MVITTRFEIGAPIEAAWAYLLDVPKIAHCVPGASLTEVIDDKTYAGKVETPASGHSEAMNWVKAGSAARAAVDPQRTAITATMNASLLMSRHRVSFLYFTRCGMMES